MVINNEQAPIRWADLPHNGKTWRDMPGENVIMKRLNFALYRRGLLENHDEDEEGTLIYARRRATMNDSYLHKCRNMRERGYPIDTSWSSSSEPYEERLRKCWDLYAKMNESKLMPKGWKAMLTRLGVSKWVQYYLSKRERHISPIMIEKVEKFAEQYLDGVDRSYQPKVRKKGIPEPERAAWQAKLQERFLAMEADKTMPRGWKMQLHRLGFPTANQVGLRYNTRKFRHYNLEVIDRLLSEIEKQAKQHTKDK